MGIAEVTEIYIPVSEDFGYIRAEGRWGRVSTFIVHRGVLEGMANDVVTHPNLKPAVDTAMAMKSREYARMWPPSQAASVWLVRKQAHGETSWTSLRGLPPADQSIQSDPISGEAEDIAVQLKRQGMELRSKYPRDADMSSLGEAVDGIARELLARAGVNSDVLEQADDLLAREQAAARVRDLDSEVSDLFGVRAILWKAQEIAGWDQDDEEADDDDDYEE